MDLHKWSILEWITKDSRSLTMISSINHRCSNKITSAPKNRGVGGQVAE
jgi:hypothetical protein